jgi:hypothetical protein
MFEISAQHFIAACPAVAQQSGTYLLTGGNGAGLGGSGSGGGPGLGGFGLGGDGLSGMIPVWCQVE